MTEPAIGIVGVGSYLPERVLGNDEVAARFGLPGQWIEDRTGVRRRHVADPTETSTDMAVVAAQRTLEDASVDIRQVGLIVVGSATPGRFVPSVACGVQGRLGADRAVAMDVGAGCSGFVYALHVALALLTSDQTRGPALVIGTDRYSGHLDYTDRRTAALFGDGAGAVLLDRVPRPYGFLHSSIGSDGSGEQHVGIVRTDDDRSDDPYTVVMDGRAVRGFIEERLPAVLDEALSNTGLSLPDLDLVIPHQANPQLIGTLLAKAGVEVQQMWFTGQECGNTGAASVPITLDSARRAGRLTDGAVILLAGLGAGLTWGSAMTRWGPVPR